MTDDRAVIKEPVLTMSTNMWVLVQVPSNSRRFIPKLQANRQRTANSPIKLTVNRNHAKKQTEIEFCTNEKKQIQQKRSKLKQ